jgi:predicted enzyme related to lactoylglutathione lyase
MTDSNDSPERAQPEAFRAREVSASLTVSDLEKSLAWYTDVLGFTVDRRHEREGNLFAVSLKAGAVRLLITQDNGNKGVDRAKGEGFSLMFTTAQNIDDLAARIKARGGTLATEPFDAFGGRAFRIVDPDGFRFAISSERS